MPRPMKAVRPVYKDISVPLDLCAKVDLMLFSELEQRVPYGAWSKYVEELIRKDLSERGKHAKG